MPNRLHKTLSENGVTLQKCHNTAALFCKPSNRIFKQWRISSVFHISSTLLQNMEFSMILSEQENVLGLLYCHQSLNSNTTNTNCENSVFAVLRCCIRAFRGGNTFSNTSTQTHRSFLYASQLRITQPLLSVKRTEHYRRIVLNNGQNPQLAAVKQTDISCQLLFGQSKPAQEKLF